VKAVPELSGAMAVASVVSVMDQPVDEATEPVREACCGEERGDPPPCPSAIQLHCLFTAFLICFAGGSEGTSKELVARTLAASAQAARALTLEAQTVRA
jgi:hypothetical protein